MKDNNILYFERARNPNKKYRAVLADGSGVEFGSSKYQHYEDRTPLKLYSHLDHKDKIRRYNYRQRHGAIMTKTGIPAINVKYSPAWFSYYYLW